MPPSGDAYNFNKDWLFTWPYAASGWPLQAIWRGVWNRSQRRAHAILNNNKIQETIYQWNLFNNACLTVECAECDKPSVNAAKENCNQGNQQRQIHDVTFVVYMWCFVDWI